MCHVAEAKGSALLEAVYHLVLDYESFVGILKSLTLLCVDFFLISGEEKC